MIRPRQALGSVAALALANLSTGCLELVPYRCASDDACDDDGKRGVCEPTGFCSFPSDSCEPSGRRYGDLAGDGRAGLCVEAPSSANLVANSSFEDGLEGWFGYNATLALDPTAHLGEASCRVCQQTDVSNFSIDDDPNSVIAPRGGLRFAASAWVRRVPGAKTDSALRIFLREWGPTTFENVEAGAYVELSDAWAQVTVTHQAVMDRTSIDVFVANSSSPSGTECFLVDDIEIHEIP